MESMNSIQEPLLVTINYYILIANVDKQYGDPHHGGIAGCFFTPHLLDLVS